MLFVMPTTTVKALRHMLLIIKPRPLNSGAVLLLYANYANLVVRVLPMHTCRGLARVAEQRIS